jgi:membrane fusion protein (multidrug efflux system)
MRFLRRWSVFIVLGGLLAALLVSKLLLSPSSQPTAGGGGGGGRQAAVVRVHAVEPEDVRERIVLNGSLVADEGVLLRAETSGAVVGVHFNEGGCVRRGDLLIKIRDDELQAQRRSAIYDLELASLNERRQERLLQSQSTTQEAFDEARIRRQNVEAQVALIDARIAKTELRAPFDGRIGLRNISPGAMVDTNTVVAALQAVDLLKVDFSVPERYLAEIATGQMISLRVEGVDRTFEGEIIAIEPRIDEVTRTLLCRARVHNDEGVLLPGGFATIELFLRRLDNAMMVPSVAIIPDLERTTLFVATDGRAEERVVRIGLRTADRVQVTEGLRPGDQVIVAGMQGLRNGTAVEVIP